MSKEDAQKKEVITQEGYNNLQEELERRKSKVREDIANRLEEATEQGDLSENSAYKSALEDKELNETRIAEIEEILSNSIVKSNDNDPAVGIGDKCKIKRLEDGKEFEVEIVGKEEANPAEKKISSASPIGAGMHGLHKGDKFTAKLPSGNVEYKIVDIE